MSKIFLNFLTVFTLLLGTSVFSQSIPSSLGTTRCYNCVPNSGWTKVSGTPGVSDSNNAVNTGADGGGTAWSNAPLPLPPNNNAFWMTMRDFGNTAKEEVIRTTLTGLTIGREYEIFIYSSTTKAPIYSPDYNDSFDYQLQGSSRVTVSPVSKDVWATNRLRFTATAATRTLSFYSGSNASGTNFQSVNISVSLNAINAVPIAKGDFDVTIKSNPVSKNVTLNDTDQGGGIDESTVDLDPSTPGIQNAITTAQGTWTVNNVGVVTFIAVANFSGLATIPYTVQDKFVLDGVSAPSTSAPADFTVFVQVPFIHGTSDLYLSQYNTGASGTTKLYTLDIGQDPLKTTPIGSPTDTGIQINAIGYHPTEDFIYGINTVDNHLLRIGKDFTIVDLGTVSGLPLITNTNADSIISGEIDNAGNYYVKENGLNSGKNLYKINIADKSATLITLSQALSTADFAFNITDGMLYGVGQGSKQLYKINPANGNVTFISGPAPGGNFGAMFSDAFGTIYGNLNDDSSFYKFDIVTGKGFFVGRSISASGNDGAHSVTEPIKFKVDLSVTKTDGKRVYVPGSTNTYTVVVSNAGPFTALNALVSDIVPAGISAGTVTYTAVKSAGSTTSVVGTKTGDINDVVNILAGGKITYTITFMVPSGFTGDLVNTVTVTPSQNNEDTNLNNNTATDTDVDASTPVPFGCTPAMYLSQSDRLYDIITTSNPFTFPPIGAAYGSNINAIGLNPLDGMMYGIVTSSNTLVKINALGQVTSLGAVPGLPIATYNNINAGDFDSLGNYYVKNATPNNTIFKIDITTKAVTIITLSANLDIPDFAYNPIDHKFYGVNNTSGRLVSFDISTNPATVQVLSTTNDLQPFGAMFASSKGEIYGSLNTGGFYQFNILDGTRTFISDSPLSGVNDGAHCSNAPIIFDADLYVTKTDGKSTYAPGTTTTYTVVVGNKGPFGVQGATVTDPLPLGIQVADISYTAVVTGNATTSVSGTKTGAINDLVSIPVGATVTYTVVVKIPVTFFGDLTNSVAVTAPVNIIDPDLSNNAATDTDDQGVCYNAPNTATAGADTNHGITLLQKAGDDNGNWPMIRKSAHTVLESNTKGFVITRMTTAQINAIVSPQEGMMVYDTDLKCLKINSNSTTGGWGCFNAPACP